MKLETTGSGDDSRERCDAAQWDQSMDNEGLKMVI